MTELTHCHAELSEDAQGRHYMCPDIAWAMVPATDSAGRRHDIPLCCRHVFVVIRLQQERSR